ncbi:hypothetical protein [Psilogramma increta granulovirus]|uniref:Uncharacterized protein n=1 Tax=Psilogramma increta granulovirus TaxID=2953508 RepID=A0A977XUZ5_9BBAC|nr:hypothetical protein [Psilogramma increta granulovirus]
MFYITLDNVIIPVINTSTNVVYMGLSELKQYYCINGVPNADVLSECCTYRDLVGSNGGSQFESSKLFVSKVGAVLLFESNNIHYNCYWYIFSIINNVLTNCDSNNEGGECIDYTSLLENIQKDVTIIKEYVTVNPFG